MGGVTLNDIRYAFRMLLKSKAYTASGVLALAFGIGANTAIFSVADAFLLKPVALPHLENLVVLMQRSPHQTAGWTSVSPGDFSDWKRETQSYAALCPYRWDEVNLTGSGDPEMLEAVRASGNFFNGLGAAAMLGRTFLPEEERAGMNQVAVLSYGLWQRRFGGDRGIVGKTIKLDGLSHTVIGVMDKEFNFPVSAEIWVPRALDPKGSQIRGRHYLQIAARLKPRVSIRQASAELATIASRLARQYPDTDRGWGAEVIPIRHFVTGDLTASYTLMVMVAVGFVLLMACANVANLQFARGASRQREFALRTAIGAARRRIVRQLLTESMALSLCGAVVGLGLAVWGVDLILRYMPADIARYIAGWYEIHLDTRAFAFALAIAVMSGVISGLAPAIQSSKPDLNEVLKESGRGTSAGRSRQRVRSVLVVAELALALVLLIGAALMVKGVNALLVVQRPSDPAHVLSVQLNLPESKYKTSRQIAAFYEQSLRQLASVPEIESAAVVRCLPYGDGCRSSAFTIEGRQFETGDQPVAQIEPASPDYFRLMRIPLRAGRLLNDGDGAGTVPVAVVSEAMARRYWPGQDALGKRIRVGTAEAAGPWLTVVGVVGDIRYAWEDKEPLPAIYQSYQQAPSGWTTLAIRTHGDPYRAARAVRSQIAKVDADQPLAEIKALDRVISDALLGNSYVAVMMIIAGVIALALSAIGVSGLMAFAVTERTHEIGVRLALGASRDTVLRMLVGRGMLLAGIGLAIGFAGSVLLARLLSDLIFGVSATDWTTFGGMLAALAAVALLASYIPARRAARLDPVSALRHD